MFYKEGYNVIFCRKFHESFQFLILSLSLTYTEIIRMLYYINYLNQNWTYRGKMYNKNILMYHNFNQILNIFA